MKSIERRFQLVLTKKPGLSSYLCFAQAVMDQKFSHKAIQIWFERLVDKQDYSREDRVQLVRQLHTLSNPSEDGRI